MEATFFAGRLNLSDEYKRDFLVKRRVSISHRDIFRSSKRRGEKVFFYKLSDSLRAP